MAAKVLISLVALFLLVSGVAISEEVSDTQAKKPKAFLVGYGDFYEFPQGEWLLPPYFLAYDFGGEIGMWMNERLALIGGVNFNRGPGDRWEETATIISLRADVLLGSSPNVFGYYGRIWYFTGFYSGGLKMIKFQPGLFYERSLGRRFTLIVNGRAHWGVDSSDPTTLTFSASIASGVVYEYPLSQRTSLRLSVKLGSIFWGPIYFRLALVSGRPSRKEIL